MGGPLEVVCTSCGAREESSPFGRCACGSPYCGSTCQRADWAAHRALCPAMVARPVEGKDLGMVATRRAKLGDLLASEQPVLAVRDAYRKGGKQRFLDSFRELAPEQREAILALYDPGRSNLQLGEEQGGENVEKEQEEQEEQEESAWRILWSNGINVGREGEHVHALYSTLSRINHSCQANTFQRCSGQARTVSFFASRGIAKNQEVTLNYLGSTSVLLTREERRQRLAKGWFFTCTCHVCSLEGDLLILNDNIRKTLASFRDQMEFITNCSPRDYTLGKEEAVAAYEEERKKVGMVAQVGQAVVAALGPTALPMLQEELANIHYTIKHNMSDISYYL